MSDIEQRLREALEARADLVQPEDLTLSPVYEPAEEQAGPWWQHPGSYLFIAAVAVIVIALPLLALAATSPDRNKNEPGPAESPSDDVTMTDPMQVDDASADVDGDGTADDIRVTSVSASGAVGADFAIEVDLSATDTTVTYDLGAVGDAEVAATANVDGRRGEEIVAVLTPESVDLHRAEPVVVGLRDDALASLLGNQLDSVGKPDQVGVRTYWWVHDAELWWWRSTEPVAENVKDPFSVEVLRFPRESPLRGVPEGTSCVRPTAQTELIDCDAVEPPTGDVGATDRGDTGGTGDTGDTGDTGEAGGERWWELPLPSGVPTTWQREDGFVGFGQGDLDGDGQDDTYGVTRGSSPEELRVNLGDERLAAPFPGDEPKLDGLALLPGSPTPVIVGHTTEATADTTFVKWRAWVVRGGRLVELDAPAPPYFGSQRSNLPPSEGGHPRAQTWKVLGVGPTSVYGLDYLDEGTFVTDHPSYPDGVRVYRVDVLQWTVAGTRLRAQVLGQACAIAGSTTLTGCPSAG